MGVGSAPRIKVEGLDLLVRVVRVVSDHAYVKEIRGMESLIAHGVLHGLGDSSAFHRPSPDLQVLSAGTLVMPPVQTKASERPADRYRGRRVVVRVELQRLGLRQVAD